MEDTQYKLNNTEHVLNKMKEPLNLDAEIIDVFKQAVVADIKANLPKKESKSIKELADENRLIK
ncbi:hypothetical protein EUA49_10495 [Staphylococcus saprophyticus]|uniref:hypothetical protein n=1 Tax=Staphylococcus saprophyticus TaxID=29385 RepID=UPI001013CF10|nr:hypothetical protein [Staphylococcus saprophyticus]RXS01969.1 hypothetical protein EUA49_10495 [Staphylococcus saprophyticus]